jgi:hypothetical protein
MVEALALLQGSTEGLRYVGIGVAAGTAVRARAWGT